MSVDERADCRTKGRINLTVGVPISTSPLQQEMHGTVERGVICTDRPANYLGGPDKILLPISLAR